MESKATKESTKILHFFSLKFVLFYLAELHGERGMRSIGVHQCCCKEVFRQDFER